MEIQDNISLAPYTSWRVGGAADHFALPRDLDELKEALLWAYQNNKKVTPLGGGTNVLISDKGVRGLVIGFKNFSGVQETSDEKTFRLTCLAGTLKRKALRFFLKAELPPALFLSGLPGDLAGGVVMNAGVSESLTPKNFCEIVESFKVLKQNGDSFTEEVYQNGDVEWSYRNTKGWQPGLITEVTLAWSKADHRKGLKDEVRKAQELRASKQPLGQPSCGSVFKNPYDDPKNTEKKSAGRLIEEAGLKGYAYGGAEISRKHANFLVNTGRASALDLHCALSLAKEKVHQDSGILLRTEVEYLGDWEGLI